MINLYSGYLKLFARKASVNYNYQQIALMKSLCVLMAVVVLAGCQQFWSPNGGYGSRGKFRSGVEPYYPGFQEFYQSFGNFITQPVMMVDLPTVTTNSSTQIQKGPLPLGKYQATSPVRATFETMMIVGPVEVAARLCDADLIVKYTCYPSTKAVTFQVPESLYQVCSSSRGGKDYLDLLKLVVKFEKTEIGMMLNDARGSKLFEMEKRNN